jgi:putative DNA methylase
VSAPPFTGKLEERWPTDAHSAPRAVYLSCADSADTALADRSIDLIVTDPPFFDNVHYSELADFFFAWQQLAPDHNTAQHSTTRSPLEVQDSDADRFAAKLRMVFREGWRILKDDGLLVFTYHHSRDAGWAALSYAVLASGFAVVNAHPVKAEMSVAAPKSQAKEPIQLDIIIVCRKQNTSGLNKPLTVQQAVESAKSKLRRLLQQGFTLSRNDRKIVLFGQLLATLRVPSDAAHLARIAEANISATLCIEQTNLTRPQQQLLFEDA